MLLKQIVERNRVSSRGCVGKQWKGLQDRHSDTAGSLSHMLCTDSVGGVLSDSAPIRSHLNDHSTCFLFFEDLVAFKVLKLTAAKKWFAVTNKQPHKFSCLVYPRLQKRESADQDPHPHTCFSLSRPLTTSIRHGRSH